MRTYDSYFQRYVSCGKKEQNKIIFNVMFNILYLKCIVMKVFSRLLLNLYIKHIIILECLEGRTVQGILMKAVCDLMFAAKTFRPRILYRSSEWRRMPLDSSGKSFDTMVMEELYWYTQWLLTCSTKSRIICYKFVANSFCKLLFIYFACQYKPIHIHKLTIVK